MIQQEKNRLRQEMKQQLQKRQPTVKDLELLLGHIQTLPGWPKARTVLLFSPLPHEPNLLSLLEHSENSFHRFFFPLMRDNELDLYEWIPGASWTRGPHGIREPDPKTWQQRNFSEVDLALIPGLAFDAEGGRLGWGKGYFDRLFENSNCHTLKVGIAWSWQIIPTVPRESHDVKMDFVVTPEKVFNFV